MSASATPPPATSAGLRPFDLIEPLGLSEIELGPDLRHIELYTMRGLVGVLWHGPFDATQAVIACGGGMGGFLGPGRGLYHRLGTALSERGIATLRVDYRRPSDLEPCVIDAAVAADLAAQRGATRFVSVGHSFGGAVAINLALAVPSAVAGVCTLSTQSAGCERVGGIVPKPFLLIHGELDTILPPETSQIVQALAGGHGEVVILPGDDHGLSHSGDIVLERLLEWIPATLAG
jgi:pimeloyl-ACP methyl ester carboxylesterase